MKEMPNVEEMDRSFHLSIRVKVWKNINVTLPPNPDAVRKDGSIDATKGPFFEKWKHEIKIIMSNVMDEVNAQIDWNKPDEILTVTPKWFPGMQYVKFTGK